MAGELILIIDDNPLSLKMVSYLLINKGYKVHAVSSAEEALDILEILQPRIILMGIQLPGMNGLELARKLKSEIKYQNIPIIAITAYAMEGDKEEVLAAGFDTYLAKPIDALALLKIITNYLLSDKKES